MTERDKCRSWSALTEDERTALLAAYQPVVDAETPTCSFEVKLSRMKAWLAEQGISVTEAYIRAPQRRPPPETTGGVSAKCGSPKADTDLLASLLRRGVMSLAPMNPKASEGKIQVLILTNFFLRVSVPAPR